MPARPPLPRRILFYTGKNYKVGETTTAPPPWTSWRRKQERGITIQSAATTCFWSRQSHDAGTSSRSTSSIPLATWTSRPRWSPLLLLDGAVAVFDGKEGDGAFSPKPCGVSGRKVRRSAYMLHQQDGQAGRELLLPVDTIKEKLGATPIVMQLPIGSENDFTGVVDPEMQAYLWNGTEELGANYDTTEIPDDLKDKAQEYHGSSWKPLPKPTTTS